MTNYEQIKCHGIIHSASASAGAIGFGLAQLPCSDNFLIAPIQLTMTISLGLVFDIELSESAAAALTSSAAAATGGRALSQVLFGWFPLAGNIINSATAATLTEAIGWKLASDFSKRAA